eukprot:TRINITY_DN627_c0_g1_i1.p2 TRINITY_DN627_c0_g1~~TRINITY_DN627_c0_g1_i1.p2  ORF type:complete len:101 (-),score=4.50 TRINITY_DN627_c0_g1_i1:1354-1656(-)
MCIRDRYATVCLILRHYKPIFFLLFELWKVRSRLLGGEGYAGQTAQGKLTNVTLQLSRMPLNVTKKEAMKNATGQRTILEKETKRSRRKSVYIGLGQRTG